MATENSIVMCIESLFHEQPSHLQIKALEPTILIALPKVELEAVAMKSVNIQILYRKILEESLILSQHHADMLRFESAQDRYQKLVKEPAAVGASCAVGVYRQLSADDTRDTVECPHGSVDGRKIRLIPPVGGINCF